MARLFRGGDLPDRVGHRGEKAVVADDGKQKRAKSRTEPASDLDFLCYKPILMGLLRKVEGENPTGTGPERQSLIGTINAIFN
jgi:hypothetical protein